MKAYGSRRIYDTPPQMKAARARVKKEGETEVESGLELAGELPWVADEVEDLPSCSECFDRGIIPAFLELTPEEPWPYPCFNAWVNSAPLDGVCASCRGTIFIAAEWKLVADAQGEDK